jgi:hypothetical protein
VNILTNDKRCDIFSLFEVPSSSVILKINDLVFDHEPSEEKIVKATNRMEMARIGKFPKRKPIKVRKLSNNKYLILDGNTTTTVLKKWGCSQVIAQEIFD